MATQSNDTAESVKVIAGAFDPWRELAAFQEDHLNVGQYGATATFVGTMRDLSLIHI